MQRRPLIAAALGAPALARAQAEWRPSRPVTLIVPFAAGSGTDAVARVLAPMLSAELGGVGVTVDNRPGANGSIAAMAVVRAPADGHTLLVTTNTPHAANPWLMRRLDYDPIADFTPISRLGNYTFWLTVNPGVPARNLGEFVTFIRANPGRVTYASGNASGIVASAAIARYAGVEMTHVPYRSVPPALTDVLAGRVDSIVVDLAPSIAHVRDRGLFALGITSGQRSALVPEVPTLAEQGMTGFEMLSWAALLGPARLPGEVAQGLSAAMLRIGAKPEYREAMARVWFEGITSTPEELGRFIVRQIASWGEMIRSAGIEPE
ncbi:MAG: tripartite tricarboxylate transporter substrate binding protein [Rubritepida sp.]|jgi:tripartite-type tricarboxylate transporter receptor subunit TctC|nr:tripartite tricarboxylate transporter substrate binding protein [Rubritepida sp.]